MHAEEPKARAAEIKKNDSKMSPNCYWQYENGISVFIICCGGENNS